MLKSTLWNLTLEVLLHVSAKSFLLIISTAIQDAAVSSETKIDTFGTSGEREEQ
jgi:hypothetical protein